VPAFRWGNVRQTSEMVGEKCGNMGTTEVSVTSLMVDKSASKDFRKAVFTRCARAVERFSSGSCVVTFLILITADALGLHIEWIFIADPSANRPGLKSWNPRYSPIPLSEWTHLHSEVFDRREYHIPI
jgi:hypothetical protein